MGKEKFFDDNGLMAPWGENACLFSWTYDILSWKAGRMPSTKRTKQVAKYITKSKYVLRDSPTTKEPWSDDNHIALLCVNKIMKQYDPEFWKYDERFFYQYWWRRWQPKHFIFFLYACKWTRIFSYPLLWIMSLWFVGSVLSEKKNGGVLDTDGDILIFLILTAYPELKLTRRMCEWARKKNSLADNWKKLFEIYYRDEDHPNRNMPRKSYLLHVRPVTWPWNKR